MRQVIIERPPAGWLVLAALGSAFTACLYDPDHRCGPDQILTEGQCACAPGTAISADGHSCVVMACADRPHRVVRPDSCDCEYGYDLNPDTDECDLSPIGQPCPQDGSTCAQLDPRFPMCVGTGSDSYCTSQGCSLPSECLGGYLCDTRITPSFCARPPSGLTYPCKTQQDCASYQASHCETVQGFICLIPNCNLTNDDCPATWHCCDFSALSGMGFPPSMCIPVDNDCP